MEKNRNNPSNTNGRRPGEPGDLVFLFYLMLWILMKFLKFAGKFIGDLGFFVYFEGADLLGVYVPLISGAPINFYHRFLINSMEDFIRRHGKFIHCITVEDRFYAIFTFQVFHGKTENVIKLLEKWTEIFGMDKGYIIIRTPEEKIITVFIPAEIIKERRGRLIKRYGLFRCHMGWARIKV